MRMKVRCHFESLRLHFAVVVSVKVWFCIVSNISCLPLSASERRSEQPCHEGDVQELRGDAGQHSPGP